MGKRRPTWELTRKEIRSAMSRWAGWAMVLGAIIAVLALQSGSKAAFGAVGIALVGKPAPDFTIKLFNGQSVTLSSLKGKPVLVNFWHSG
jgi:cytochrome c biogenesis protein CcmG/thiol:disulfide interchange protein DsbE